MEAPREISDLNTLLPCPCGKVPTELHLVDNGQGFKWANASGDCCGEWMIEFRTEYYKLDSPAAMNLAFHAWNAALRASAHEAELAKLREENERLKFMLNQFKSSGARIPIGDCSNFVSVEELLSEKDKSND